jgi:hypothetical protein
MVDVAQPDLLQAILSALNTKLNMKLQLLAECLQVLDARDSNLDNYWHLKDDAYNPNWGKKDAIPNTFTADDYAIHSKDDADMATC